MNFDNIFKINRKEAVREMFEISNPSNNMCKQCLHGKQTRTYFRKNEYSTKKPLEIVHTDICGSMRTKGMNGEKYFILLIDDYIRIIGVCFVKKKSESFECFRIFKEMVENDRIEKQLLEIKQWR
jgi:hypothetical protein